jgi:hypothetical protein
MDAYWSPFIYLPRLILLFFLLLENKSLSGRLVAVKKRFCSLLHFKHLIYFS